MLSRVVIFIVLMLAACITHAQPTYLLNKPFGARYYQLDSLEDAIWSHNDSAQSANCITDLEKWADNQDDDELFYFFRLLQLRNSLHFRLANNGYIESALPEFIEKMHKMNMLALQAEGLSMLSDYYWREPKTYGLAFEYSLDAYNIYSKIPAKDFPRKSLYTYGIGLSYYRFRDYHNALTFLKEAVNTTPMYKYQGVQTTFNTLGLTYRNLGLYDSAEFYFKHIYSRITDTAGDIWAGIISGNLGITYYWEAKYAEAIPYLEKDIRTCMKFNARDNACNSMAFLGDVYLHLGDTKTGLSWLLQAYDVVLHDSLWRRYEILVNVFPRLSRAYALNGNYELAYSFMDSARKANDSLNVLHSQLTLSGAEHRFEIEKHAGEIEKRDKQKKINTWVRNGLIGAVGLVWIIAFLIINRQKLSSKLKNEQLEAEKANAETSLKNANDMLESFTHNMFEKNELLARFNAELEQLRKLPGADKVHHDMQALSAIQQSAILSGEQWDQFLRLFDKANPHYVRRLKHKVPGLSPIEIRFIVLSKLHTSSREMATILGVSIESVQSNKQKLKTRLNLPDTPDSLEEFSRTI